MAACTTGTSKANERVTMATNETEPAPEERKIQQYFVHLESLINLEQWDGLTEQLQQADAILTQPTNNLRLLGAVLANAACRPTVPIDVFEVAIAKGGEDALNFTDENGRTPFHEVQKNLDRPDITRLLLEACPRLVNIRDEEGLRGVDILTQKILMKEEHLRYLKDNASPQDHQSLADCLECARLVTVYHGVSGENIQQEARQLDLPMLHACCMARGDVPLSLVERTLRRYGALQVCVKDNLGNTVRLNARKEDSKRRASTPNHCLQW